MMRKTARPRNSIAGKLVYIFRISWLLLCKDSDLLSLGLSFIRDKSQADRLNLLFKVCLRIESWRTARMPFLRKNRRMTIFVLGSFAGAPADFRVPC